MPMQSAVWFCLICSVQKGRIMRSLSSDLAQSQRSFFARTCSSLASAKMRRTSVDLGLRQLPTMLSSCGAAIPIRITKKQAQRGSADGLF